MPSTRNESVVNRNSEMGTHEMLLQSARTEIEKHGVLGLRVLDVAAGAHCSVTQIYRYFGSRNGLIAHALGDLYQELLDAGLDAAKHVLGESALSLSMMLCNCLFRRRHCQIFRSWLFGYKSSLLLQQSQN